MGNLGFGEILLILVVVLLVFGTSRLPALGDALGRAIRNFRKSSEDAPAGGAAKELSGAEKAVGDKQAPSGTPAKK
jgi:sec-independent protein translocase protein TatA